MMPLTNELQPELGNVIAAPGNQVQLEGAGPFLFPFLGDEVSFGFGDNVAVMRMKTAQGQEVLLPFGKETLRTIGLALADALKEAFQDDRNRRLVPDDLTFETRDEV